jgi:hypothetical protein
MRLFLLSAIAFLLFSTVAAARPLAGSVTCEGYVVSAFGGPLHSARVTLQSRDGKSATSIITKSDGYFKLGELKDGDYEITITLLGFADFKKQLYLSGVSEDLGALGLQVGGTTDLPRFPVAGTVLDPSEKPMPGALVTVRRPFVASATYQSRTNAHGKYEIEVATPGQYLVYVTKEGFTMAVVPLVLPAGLDRPRSEVNFKLTVLKWEQPPVAKPRAANP